MLLDGNQLQPPVPARAPLVRRLKPNTGQAPVALIVTIIRKFWRRSSLARGKPASAWQIKAGCSIAAASGVVTQREKLDNALAFTVFHHLNSILAGGGSALSAPRAAPFSADHYIWRSWLWSLVLKLDRRGRLTVIAGTGEGGFGGDGGPATKAGLRF